MYDFASGSTSFSALGIVIFEKEFFFLASLIVVKWYLIGVLMCISPMTNDEYAFMALFAVCMSSLECLFFSLSIFLGPHPWHMEVPRLGVKSEL